MTPRGPTRAVAALMALVLAPVPGLAGDAIGPGAYCPLPEKGEEPRCLAPARDEYQNFFAALSNEGELDDAAAARLEADVAAGAGGARPYLALSSLSYGYYRLAHQAAATPGEDPEIVARLERWNALLARAWEGSGADAEYRSALRQAATDLHDRAPLGLPCRDAAGRPAECNSTEVVLRGLDTVEGEVGVRGALENLFERVFGEPAP